MDKKELDKSYLEKFLADVEKLKRERDEKRNRNKEYDCDSRESN